MKISQHNLKGASKVADSLRMVDMEGWTMSCNICSGAQECRIGVARALWVTVHSRFQIVGFGLEREETRLV